VNTSWKSRLAKLESLLKGSANRSYEIAVELRSLWNDKTFLAEACKGRPDEADRILSRFIEATHFDLNELLQMLEQFPNEADWKDGNLRRLYNETCKAIAAKRGKSGGSKDDKGPKRHRVTIAEYEELQRKYKASQAEIRRLRADYAKLLDKLPQLAKAK